MSGTEIPSIFDDDFSDLFNPMAMEIQENADASTKITISFLNKLYQVTNVVSLISLTLNTLHSERIFQTMKKYKRYKN